MSNSYGVDNVLAVPQYLKQDPGLEFDRLRWRNRRGRLDGSLEILYRNSLKTETQMVRPDKWWEQRESVVRSLYIKKDIKLLIKFQANMPCCGLIFRRSRMVIRLDSNNIFKFSRICDKSFSKFLQ